MNFTRKDAERWRHALYREALERLVEERTNVTIGLEAMGHDREAGVKVEQALEWLLRQPITQGKSDATEAEGIARV